MDVHEFDELNEATVKGWGAPYFQDDSVTLWHGDALDVLTELPDGSVNCIVTSPPYYGLRDYGIEGQYGLEESPAAYVETMRALFSEARRVLADDGTLWLNIGDSYSVGDGRRTASHPQTSTTTVNGVRVRMPRGSTPSDARASAAGQVAGAPPAKNLMGIPWRVAFALQDDGWILRNDIIWAKPNAMPESVTDRLSTKHEHLFMFAKQPRYWFDLDPIRENHLTAERPLGVLSRGATPWSASASLGQPQQAAGAAGVGRDENGKNPGDVWSIPTQPYPGAHFAVMPQALASRCIQAGCKPCGTVLDPFSGSGTTGLAAAKHGRKYVGIDLNTEYLDLSLKTRLSQAALFEDSV